MNADTTLGLIEDKNDDIEVLRSEITRLRAECASLWREKEHFRQMAFYQVSRELTAFSFRRKFAKHLPDLIEAPHLYKALQKLLTDLEEAERRADETVERLGYRLPRIWFIRLEDDKDRR